MEKKEYTKPDNTFNDSEAFGPIEVTLSTILLL